MSVAPCATTTVWGHRNQVDSLQLQSANVLSALPKSAHPGAKKALAQIWNAEDRGHALDAVTGASVAATDGGSCSPAQYGGEVTTKRHLPDLLASVERVTQQGFAMAWRVGQHTNDRELSY
jgi:hypothetical protein